MSEFDSIVGDAVEPRPLTKQNATPGAAAKWRTGRRRAIRHALDVARAHADDKSPYRTVVREVEVATRPVARGGEVIETRLEPECGHVVALPGGALAPRTKVGHMRRCKPCYEARA